MATEDVRRVLVAMGSACGESGVPAAVAGAICNIAWGFEAGRRVMATEQVCGMLALLEDSQAENLEAMTLSVLG